MQNSDNYIFDISLSPGDPSFGEELDFPLFYISPIVELSETPFLPVYNLQVTFEGTNPRYTASKSVCPISCDLYLNTIVVSCITVELHLISAISLSLSNTHTCTHTHTHAHTRAFTHARTHILSLSFSPKKRRHNFYLLDDILEALTLTESQFWVQCPNIHLHKMTVSEVLKQLHTHYNGQVSLPQRIRQIPRNSRLKFVPLSSQLQELLNIDVANLDD